MSHYSVNPGHVRVDFFKPSGKWHMTDAVDMSGVYHVSNPATALGLALEKHFRHSNGIMGLAKLTAVCLDPYCTNSFPVLGLVEDLVALGREWPT